MQRCCLCAMQRARILPSQTGPPFLAMVRSPQAVGQAADDAAVFATFTGQARDMFPGVCRIRYDTDAGIPVHDMGPACAGATGGRGGDLLLQRADVTSLAMIFDLQDAGFGPGDALRAVGIDGALGCAEHGRLARSPTCSHGAGPAAPGRRALLTPTSPKHGVGYWCMLGRRLAWL